MQTNRPINKVSLSMEDGLIHLLFPWDSEIKEEINQLQISDRTWLSPYHVTFEPDCLDIIRSIAQNAISRNSQWTFIDRTTLTDEHLQEREKLHQARVTHTQEQAFLDFLQLEQCGNGTFTLVEWGKTWLKVQLNLLLGEEAFAQIRQGSLDLGKSFLEDRHNPRFKRGWWFTVVRSPQVIALLLAKKTSNISQIGGISLNSEQPERFPQVCHCQDKTHRTWVGILLDSVPTQILNDISTLTTWQLALIEDDWYWVGETFKIFGELFSNRRRCHTVGLAQAIINLPIDEALLHLGLVGECRRYLEKLFTGEIKTEFTHSLRKSQYQSKGFWHPLDDFFDYWNLLPLETKQSFTILINLPLAEWLEGIVSEKVQAAKVKIQEDRALATSLAEPILAQMSKQELLVIGSEHSIKLIKSWNKSKIISAFASSNSYQLICESVLDLPKEAEVE